MKTLFYTFAFFFFTINIFGQIAHVTDGPILANTTNTYTTDAPSDNIYIMGVSTFANTSAGTLYDSGGSSGDYSNNETFNFYLSIGISYDFIELIIEYDTESPYDSLTVVDNGFTIGHFAGIGIDTITTLDDNVDIYFNSNSVIEGGGFRIKWRGVFLNTANLINYPEIYEPGVKFMWDPSHAAFRSGLVTSSNIGDYSAAWGKSNEARGKYSTAWGSRTEASSSRSTAWGDVVKASGYSSTAWGSGTEASGGTSTAWGSGTEASGGTSTAWGIGTEASGNYSTAWGSGTDAVAYLETALGRYNTTFALNNTSWSGIDRLFTVGNGTSSTNRNNAFTVMQNGNAFLDGSLSQSSDRTLKEKIKPIKNTQSLLAPLGAYTYYWKDKELRNSDKQIGVIAQEVKEVLPELVGEENGHLTVNYIGLIPILIEANNEQQEEILGLKVENEELRVLGDELKVENEELKNRLSKIETFLNQNGSFKTENPTQSILPSPTLKQNTPNPFYHKTQIECFVPKTTKNAFIQITDIERKVVKVVEIENRGDVIVHISGKSLEQGTYFYSLVVDEKMIDTKQMILTK